MSVIDRIFDYTMPALEKAMDLTWRRNQAIVSNVANAETPQYRAVDLNFGVELERVFDGGGGADMVKTHQRHMDINNQSGAHLVSDFSGATKADGNNVDVDIQMGRLMENSGKFKTAAGLLRKQLRMARMALSLAQR